MLAGALLANIQKFAVALDQVRIQKEEEGSKEPVAEKVAETAEATPAAAKGQYIKSVSVTTTMGPGIFINQK